MVLSRLAVLATASLLIGSYATAGAPPQGPDHLNPPQLAATANAQPALQGILPVDLSQVSSTLLARVAQVIVSAVVTGAPYSAHGVTQSSTTLADGTHISHSVSYAICRDSAGRLRREDTQGVWIADPVSKVTYLLDPATHVARQLPLATLVVGVKVSAAPWPGASDLTRPGRAQAPPTLNPFKPRDVAPPFPSPPGTVMNVLDLGRQIVNGVTADGSRSTSVIPVGAIGNDRPIEVIWERWLSPDLQILVMSHGHDPRSGDTTFHLTDLRRKEPDRTLFVVPAEYRIEVGK
jgi:hypothetical protein